MIGLESIGFLFSKVLASSDALVRQVFIHVLIQVSMNIFYVLF